MIKNVAYETTYDDPEIMRLADADDYEIDSDVLQFKETIGEGEFGKVLRAHINGFIHRARDDVVAVKTLKGRDGLRRD